MINQKLAKIFYEVAEYLEMQDVEFKPRAYERVARVIESMEDDVADIYRKGGVKAVEEIPGVGIGIAEKIEEFIKTGKIKYHQQLRKTCPVDLEGLTAIEGVGPKMIKIFYQKLNVRTINDLEKAAKAGKVEKLPRLGPKVQENILRSIEFAKSSKGRFLLGFILPLVRKMEQRFKDLDFIEEAMAAGSVRRMKETIGDIDILVISSNPTKVMDFFVSMPEVIKVYAKGELKSSVRLDLGLDADVRVVSEKSFGAALQYFTGSKDHNIALRKIAVGKKLKLNEYGVFRGKKQIAGKNEQEVYKVLGLEWMAPELRENKGEIELSQKGKLPKIVEYREILGDLQMHSNWSDGSYSIKEMAEAARRLGYKYIAMTDHTGELRIAGGMDEKTILKYIVEIDKLNKQLSGIKILKGVEVNIRKDGSLDILDKVLAKLDIVLASVHSNFKMSKKDMTERICRAMENPHVDIIAHPTARVIQRREGYEVDFDKILECAKKTNTVLEINSYPDRLDLNDVHIKRAIEAGVELSIGTDSHSKTQLHNIELGIAQARRGWAEKKDIINTMDYEELLKFLKKNR